MASLPAARPFTRSSGAFAHRPRTHQSNPQAGTVGRHRWSLHGQSSIGCHSSRRVGLSTRSCSVCVPQRVVSATRIGFGILLQGPVIVSCYHLLCVKGTCFDCGRFRVLCSTSLHIRSAVQGDISRVFFGRYSCSWCAGSEKERMWDALGAGDCAVPWDWKQLEHALRVFSVSPSSSQRAKCRKTRLLLQVSQNRHHVLLFLTSS